MAAETLTLQHVYLPIGYGHFSRDTCIGENMRKCMQHIEAKPTLKAVSDCGFSTTTFETKRGPTLGCATYFYEYERFIRLQRDLRSVYSLKISQNSIYSVCAFLVRSVRYFERSPMFPVGFDPLITAISSILKE